MQLHNLIQGSDAWHQFRALHFGASEAAAMLGLSKNMTRNQLLRLKKTGIGKEHSVWTQENILDKGHVIEALALPHIQEIVGDELYPVTCSDGELSASCDGLTMGKDIAVEHKQWNAAYAALVAAGEVPPEHMPQCQQVLMVTKAEKLLFVISDGTSERMVHVWVLPDREWFTRLRDGWTQFAKDLAIYVPAEVVEPVEAEPIKGLPTLVVQLRGEVTISNLDAYRKAADEFIAGINTDLKTDLDFATAALNAKFCDESEKQLVLVKKQALAQTSTIDDLFRTIDHITAQLSAKRLMLDKLVVSKKQSLKEAVIGKAKAAWAAHVADLQLEVAPTIRLNMLTAPDLVGAASHKRTLESLHNAVDTELASAKAVADNVARGVRVNLAVYNAIEPDVQFLFADVQAIISQPAEVFLALIQSRIAEHDAKQLARLERERADIRAEEQAKAETEARAKLAQEARDAVPTVEATVQAEVAPLPAAARRFAGPPLLAAMPKPTSTRAQINTILESLSEADLGRVLSFVQSRFAEVAA